MVLQERNVIQYSVYSPPWQLSGLQPMTSAKRRMVLPYGKPKRQIMDAAPQRNPASRAVFGWKDVIS